MKPVYFISIVVFSAFFSCKSASSKVTDEQIQALERLVENKNFNIESTWAYPQTTMALQQVLNAGLLQPGNSPGAINLIGNSNFLKISGDSITSFLPYFGERQMNVGYGGTDSAIQLLGTIENYTTRKGKQHSYTISCDAKSKTEHFRIIIKLYPNLKSNTTVLGTSRNAITYSGQVKSLN